MAAQTPKYLYLITSRQVGIHNGESNDGLGVRIKNIGIVPHDEVREATEKEVADFKQER